MVEYYFIDKKIHIKNPKSIVFSLVIDEQIVKEILTRNNNNIESANIALHLKGVDLIKKTSDKDEYIDVKTVNDINNTIMINAKQLEYKSVDYIASIINNNLYIANLELLANYINPETNTINTDDFIKASNNSYELTEDELKYYNTQKNIYKSYKLTYTKSTERGIDEISSEMYPAYYNRYNKYFRVKA